MAAQPPGEGAAARAGSAELPSSAAARHLLPGGEGKDEAIATRPLGVLIAPGDSVGLTPALVAEVVGRFRSDPSRPVVPTRGGKRGHPLVLPWREALAIRSLPADVGVNRLLVDLADRVVKLEVRTPGHDLDLDTPDDLDRIRRSPIPSDFSPGTLPGRPEPD